MASDRSMESEKLGLIGIAAAHGDVARGVTQLAHVAGPVMIGQARHERGRQPGPLSGTGIVQEMGAAERRELLPQERHQQTADVVAALTQGRQPDLEAAQAVEQRRPEPPLGDGAFEVGVGGGHDADVDSHRCLGPYRLDLAALQSAQQEDLHLRGGLPDLVQEEGAGVGALEIARPPPVGPGIGAARRAE